MPHLLLCLRLMNAFMFEPTWTAAASFLLYLLLLCLNTLSFIIRILLVNQQRHQPVSQMHAALRVPEFNRYAVSCTMQQECFGTSCAQVMVHNMLDWLTTVTGLASCLGSGTICIRFSCFQRNCSLQSLADAMHVTPKCDQPSEGLLEACTARN
jgi:hypothetical protein